MTYQIDKIRQISDKKIHRLRITELICILSQLCMTNQQAYNSRIMNYHKYILKKKTNKGGNEYDMVNKLEL